jgi:hypothetical protein
MEKAELKPLRISCAERKLMSGVRSDPNLCGSASKSTTYVREPVYCQRLPKFLMAVL